MNQAIKNIRFWLSVICAMHTLCLVVSGAHVSNAPVKLRQPDGTELVCFVTGDEHARRFHDKDGYTIVRNPTTRQYVYATVRDGRLTPTSFVPGIAGVKELEAAGISKGLRRDAKLAIKDAALSEMPSLEAPSPLSAAPTEGIITNLVVFIRFSDQADFEPATITEIGTLFNDSAANANSLRNYYAEASYGKLTIESHFFPGSDPESLSYQDTAHPRRYYMKYHEVDNPIGYRSNSERTAREYALVENVIELLQSDVTPGLDLDNNQDGVLDNICFLVRGGIDDIENDDLHSMLWGHTRWGSSAVAQIAGKNVVHFNFQIEEQVTDTTLGVGVLAHEMFHSLGAPDLYRSDDGNPSSWWPVHAWDVMADTKNPPQHMCAYMKYRYGKWIDTIPVITSSGTYTLNPLQDSANNCYKINSPFSTDEYFIVEYRDDTGTYESSVYDKGLIVYRINTSVSDGNYDGPPDEVYVYRAYGDLYNAGIPQFANFAAHVGRVEINDGTNPSSFLSDGNAGGLDIYNVGFAGETIAFGINILGGSILAINHQGLAIGQAGTVSVDVLAPKAGNYLLKVSGGNLSAPGWQWTNTQSDDYDLSASELKTFSFEVVPDTNVTTVKFRLYIRAGIFGIYYLIDEETRTISVGESASPVIDDVSPGSAPAGTTVVIDGSNFGITTGTVTFGGVTAVIALWSDTQIRAMAPNISTSGPIVVRTEGGLSSNSYSFNIVKTEFVLSNPRVTPLTGYSTDTYTFRVDYYDPDGDNQPPTLMELIIDDQLTYVGMILESGTASNGTYRYSLGSLSEDSHSFRFYFENGIDTPKETNVVQAPTVVGTYPPTGRNIGLTSFSVNPTSVASGEYVTLNATLTNYGAAAENAIVHWYLYEPSGEEYEHVQDSVTNIGSVPRVCAKQMTTGLTVGYWSAAVFIEFADHARDDDPLDNNRSMQLYSGPTQHYTQYVCDDDTVSTAGGSPTRGYGGHYGLVVTDFYSDSVRADIYKDGTVLASQVTLREDRQYYYDNNTYLIHVYSIVYRTSWQSISVYHGIPNPTPFDYEPENPRGPAGSTAGWKVTPPAGTTIDEPYRNDILSNAEVQSWYVDYSGNSSSYTREFEIPAGAAPGTRVNWWIMDKYSSDNTVWLRKSEFIVDPGHDISVASVSPANGLSFILGDQVPISATLSAANAYTERPTINLSVTGPDGYSYTCSATASITGGGSYAFLPAWNTVGLGAGVYVITITATVANDINSANDSGTSTITLTAPPPPLEAPVLISCLARSSTEIVVSWEDRSDNEEGFRIENSQDGVNWILRRTVGANETALVDNELLQDVLYYYRVQVFDSTPRQSYSNVLSARTHLAPGISVLSPNGGETIEVGDSLAISWKTTGSVGNVNITLLRGGSLNLAILDNVPNTGLYSWLVPDTLTLASDYQVRVEMAGNTSVFDVSDMSFSVIAMTSVRIAGTVTEGGSPLAGVVMNGLTGSPVTNASGVYIGTESVGWTGTVTPTLAGYTFLPVYRTYSAPVTSDRMTEDFSASLIAPGDENWDSQFGANGLNDYVCAIAVSGTDVYAGGQFTQAGGDSANHIAKWDTITRTWSALGSGTNGRVYAIAVSGTDVYVGGQFTDAGGVPANNIAKWDGLTNTWSALGSGLSSYVRAIAVSGTDVYAGGNFTQAGESAANYIARWDGTSWSALGGGTSGRVLTIAVNGADVYAGGFFLTAGGITVQGIAKWNATNGWSDLGGGVTGGAVYAIAFVGPDVFVAGDFMFAGSLGTGYLAIWNEANGWSSPPSWPSNYVYALAVSGTDVYVGQWDIWGPNTVKKLDTASATWSMLGSGLGPEDEFPWVYALATMGTDVYVGGKFTTAGGKSSYYFGRWMNPVARVAKVDFNKDGQEDVLWRYNGAGGYNRAWFLGNTGLAGPLLTTTDPRLSGSRVGSSQNLRRLSLTDPREIGWVKKEVERTEDLQVLMGGQDKAAIDDPRRAGNADGDSHSSPVGISDPRQVRFASEKATDDSAKLVSTPSLLGGADVMAVSDLNWQIVGTGDFNNDAQVDILWRSDSTGTNVVWYMNGTEWIGSAELLRVDDPNWQIVGTGDFNKDTHVDILWRNSSSGENVVWYLNGTTWIGSAVLLGVSDQAWKIVGTGDFNMDGNVDLLWRYSGVGGYNVVWYLNNSIWIGSAELIAVGDTSWQIMGTGDYDGDGNTDILWRYNGPGGYNVIWYMNGISWRESAELIPVPDLNWKIVSR